jgi:hypothetical protein
MFHGECSVKRKGGGAAERHLRQLEGKQQEEVETKEEGAKEELLWLFQRGCSRFDTENGSL